MITANFNRGYVPPAYLQNMAKAHNKVKLRSYELMQVNLGNNVLDVGCGPAIDTINLANLAGSNGRVIGIDNDYKMLLYE